MNHPDGLARRVALAAHRVLARSRTTTRAYGWVLSACGALLPARVANRLLNNATGVVWPDVDLAPRSVTVGARTRIRLHPHLGEFDSEAIVRDALTYEASTFRWLESRMAAYDTVVEIGANIGIYTTFFAAHLAQRGGRVIAFEPSAVAFRRLQANLAVNDRAHAVAVNAAMSACVGVASFHEPQGHLTNGSLVPEFAHIFSDRIAVRPVACLSGDVLSDMVPTSQRVLLKIDAEGAEAAVLDGLANFIRTRRPDLILEVLPDYVEAIQNSVPLRDGGWTYHELTDHGPVRRAGLTATASARDWWLTPA